MSDIETVRAVVAGYWPGAATDPRVPEALAALGRLEADLAKMREERDAFFEGQESLAAEVVRLRRVTDVLAVTVDGNIYYEVVAERDRYREALERLDASPFPLAVREIARAALEEKP